VNDTRAAIPQLELLSLDDLLEHERHDDQRTFPLVTRIQASGVWRNPPIVTPLQDGSQRFMILDGANRIAALRLMESPHAVVQVVRPDDPGLKLYNWNHVVWNFDSSEMLASIDQQQDMSIVHGDRDTSPNSAEQSLAKFETGQGDLFTVRTSTQDLEKRIGLLNAIVDIYKQRASLDRTSEWSVVRLKSAYENLCGLVIFPKFEIRQVLSLAGCGCLLPTGITRFTVSPRVLHLNYPLESMTGEGSLEKKNKHLQDFLQQRITNKGIRYYAEATYLFDE
jgi:hypothetical protein